MARSIIATTRIARGADSPLALAWRLRVWLVSQMLFSFVALAPSAMAAGHDAPPTVDASRSAAVVAPAVETSRASTPPGSDTDWSLRPIRFGHESRPSALPALYVAYGALQVYDVYSTLRALRSGGSESNPFLNDIARTPAAFIGLKAGMTGASILVSEKLWRMHRRPQAIAFMLASNGVMALVAAHNAGAAR